MNTKIKSKPTSIQYLYTNDDGVPLNSITDTETTKCHRVLTYVSSLAIEPFVFGFIFAYILSVSCLSNMMMDKGCRFHLNYTEEICSNLSGHPTEKEEVEILANNYSLYSNLMSLIAAFQMVFIAPWSDKYGRKCPLFVACFGVVLSDLGFLVCSIKLDLPLYYIVLAKTPSDMFGGFICVLTIVYSHASEVSTENSRTLKYTSVEITMGVGIALGGLIGGLLFRYFGYFYIYLTGAIVHLLCLPWIVFIVEETTGLDISPTWREKICDYFTTESLTKGTQASFRKRDKNDRSIVMLFFACMCVMILTNESFSSIGFIYVHHLYNWDQGTYSIVNTIFSFTQLLIVAVCLPLLVRVFKVSDPALGLIGIASMMGKFTLLAFAKYRLFIYYLGNVVGYFSTLTRLSIRSGISKIIDKDEIGRVFSFLSTFEIVFEMLSTFLITKLFNSTMDIYPSISYLMPTVLLLLPLGFFSWMFISSKRHQETEMVANK